MSEQDQGPGAGGGQRHAAGRTGREPKFIKAVHTPIRKLYDTVESRRYVNPSTRSPPR